MVPHRTPVLACLGLLAFTACSGENPITAPDGGALVDGGGSLDARADATLGDAGPVTVRVVDQHGAPFAGIDIVFHDPAGRAVASTVTGADGVARERLPGGGGVTLIDDAGLMSALEIPPGATLLLHRGRAVATDLFRPSPRLPPLPDLPQTYYGPAVLLRMPCEGGAPAVYWRPDEPAPQVYGSTSCVAADGTYAIEAILLFGGQRPVYYSRRSGIPATDVHPEMPPWRQDFTVLRRQLPHDSMWSSYLTSVRGPYGDKYVEASVEGDQLLAVIPALTDEELVLAGSSYLSGSTLAVEVHDVPPHAAHATLDLEAHRPRGPRRVTLSTPGPRAELTWEETASGAPLRFVVASLSWYTVGDGAVGSWSVVQPAGARRVVFPELPAAFQHRGPPGSQTTPRTIVSGSVHLADDSSVTSYGELLAGDPQALFRPELLAHEGDRVSRHAYAGTASRIDGAQTATGLSLTTDPPATDGRIRITAGASLRLTARVEGIADQRVTWQASRPSATLTADGATATLRADRPDQTILVMVRSEADPYTTNDVLVDVVPPPCLKTYPVVQPASPGLGIRLASPAALAVRRDGTPIVAVFMDVREPGTTGSIGTLINALTFDGIAWSELAPSISFGASSFWSQSGSPLALALDAEDRPIIAYHSSDEGGLVVRRLEDGRWVERTAPLVTDPGGSLTFTLDAEGDPLLALVESHEWQIWELWIARWKGGAWQRRRAFVGEMYQPIDATSIAMDGDAPIVAFQTGLRPRVVKLDDAPIDLGLLDADATFHTSPTPVLAVVDPDQPLVAWLDRESGASDAATLLRVSQRTVDGWTPAGPAMRFPGEAFPPHALVWNAATDQMRIAVPGSGPATVEVRAVADGALICAPVISAFATEYSGGIGSFGVAADPTGGTVVAADGGGITVQRVRP